MPSEELWATYIPAVGCIGIGLYVLLLRSWHARQAVEWNYRLLHIRFNEKHYAISFGIVGVAFILVGVLTVAGVIKFGPTS